MIARPASRRSTTGQRQLLFLTVSFNASSFAYGCHVRGMCRLCEKSFKGVYPLSTVRRS